MRPVGSEFSQANRPCNTHSQPCNAVGAAYSTNALEICCIDALQVHRAVQRQLHTGAYSCMELVTGAYRCMELVTCCISSQPIPRLRRWCESARMSQPSPGSSTTVATHRPTRAILTSVSTTATRVRTLILSASLWRNFASRPLISCLCSASCSCSICI